MRFSEIDVLRSVCRDSYWDFVQNFWHTVVVEEPRWNWHMEDLANLFQRAMERVFKGEPRKGDYVINISPGTSKSTIFSVLSIPWVWTRMPSAKGIFASYTHDLALDLSSKARDCVLSDEYKRIFPEIVIRDDLNTKGYFGTTAGGYRFSVGSKGMVTGRHAHFIVVDDPMDPTQAWSATEGDAINRWLQHTLPSRKVDKAIAPTFLIMQRLAENDPSGLFFTRPNVRKIILPAELTEDVFPPKYKDKYVDGLMDPIRMPRAVLRQMEEDLGTYAYAGQFLQNPTPPEGGMFKVARLLSQERPPRDLIRVVRFWDKAGTGGGGAYTAGVKMGKDTMGRYYVMNVKRVQYDSARREELIAATAEEDGFNTIVGLEEEGGSGGKESAENTVRRLAGFRVRVLKVGKAQGDKVTRADTFSTQVNAGNVTLLLGAWNADYKHELKHFPNGKYMDQVDASSGAFSMLFKRKRTVGGISGLLRERVRELMSQGLEGKRLRLVGDTAHPY